MITRKKYKFDRTIGENILGRLKSPVIKRNYKPGQHGQSKKKRKISEFGQKIHDAKKVRLFYGGMNRKQLKRIVRESVKKEGRSNDNMVKILESRLSNFVYRAKWAITPFAARQLVCHGKISVNGKKVDIGSYRLKEGDKVEIKKEMMENSHVIASIKTNERDIPEYISVKKNEATYLGANLFNTKYPTKMNFNSLVEFFTR